MYYTLYSSCYCLVALLYCCMLVAGGALPDRGLLEGQDALYTGRIRRQSGSVSSEQPSKCSGGLDIYFVLDKSGSVTENDFQQQTVNFAEALLGRFTSSKVRASFITFSAEATVVTKLTGDSGKLAKGIQKLRSVVTDGGTYIHFGIKKARSQIEAAGSETASVIVTLTDGILDDAADAEREANSVRALGASVLAVRIGDSNTVDLEKVADEPSSEHIFWGGNFNDLDSIIDKIVNTSCVEILSAAPTEVCTQDSFNVTIRGNGFSRTNDVSKVLCNFRLNDTDNQEVSPYLVTDSELVCPGPHIAEAGSFVVLQVSVNGISYISSNVTITAKNCTPPNVTGIVLGVFFTLIALALFLLWWFWQLLCCVVVVKPPPPPPAPPASPDSKKWPTVDASYYGGGGIGGIKAMRVNWGENGCTQAGSHLEKAKGAKTLAENEEGANGKLLTGESPGCLEIVKKKLADCFAPVKALYNRISVMRPTPGQKGVCCKLQR